MSEPEIDPLQRDIDRARDLIRANRLQMIQIELEVMELPPMLQGKMASAIQQLRLIETAIRKRAE